MAAIWLRDGQPIIPEMKTWKPIICAINGYAIGGGLEMALACDMRIASSKAKFGLTEVKVASLAGLNGTQSLPRAIPQAVAMKMLLTGERIDAEEALRVGLISDVVEPEKLMDVAKKYAEKIAANAPLSVRAAKQAALLGLDMPLDHGIAFSHLLWGILRDTEDRKEGFQAFSEKRSPNWQGR
jgi:E-phenylitaconyl-CoA hydratase/naphthyl-2-hydroxymethylsuccinyl-CoA hydratase